MSGLSEAALAFVHQGFAVLALAPGMKVPHATLAPNGVYSASSDAATIRAIWEQEPNANIGIRLGRYADDRHLVAFDLDNRAGGSESFIALLGKNDRLELTRCTRTADGWHFLYWSPVPTTNSDGQLGPGIEVRGEGQYIVAPPSIHPSGTRYRDEGNVEIAEVPAYLRRRIEAPLKPAPAPLPLDSQQPDLEDVRAWGGYRPFVEKALAQFHIPLLEKFRPPWRDGAGVSAEVYLDDRGLYICQDFGGDPKSMIFPEYYAAALTGTTPRMSNYDSVLWTKRAQFETGYRILTAPSLPAAVNDLEPFDRKAFEGFLLRWLLRGDETDVAFALRWAARWIGEPTSTFRRVRTSINRLRQLGLIHKSGELPGTPYPTFLYRLGDGSPDPTFGTGGSVPPRSDE